MKWKTTFVIFILALASLPLMSNMVDDSIRAEDEISTVSIVPRVSEVGFGETFLVDIVCAPVDHIKSWEASISFNPNILEINSCVEGDFFTGFDTFFVDGDIDNIEGTLNSFYNLIVGPGTVSTNGILCTLSFTSLENAGYSPIVFTNGGLTNETDYLPVNATNGGVAVAAPDWVIEGDKVFINDTNAYISATPHTLYSDGWVEFELETKSYDGNIDVIWGFDNPNCIPIQGQIWSNYSHPITGYAYFDRVGSLVFNNVTSYLSLGIENYGDYNVTFGNENNTLLYGFIHDSGANTTIAAFTSFAEIGDGDDYRLTGHYNNYESYIYYESFFDWKPWVTDFEIINYEYEGINKWWLLEETLIVHDHRYRVRAWLDVNFGSDGKYWWAMKPHTSTLSEAIAAGTFYCLDPWWKSVEYTYMKEIVIDSDYIDTDLTNFPVLVTLNSTIGSECQAAGQDIRFKQGDTDLNFEIELWNASGTSYVWVNVTSISSTSDTIFILYYGNSTVADGQNVYGTWDDNYLAVYHMSEASGNIVDSTSGQTGVPNGNPSYAQTGKTAYGIVLDGVDDGFNNGDVTYFDNRDNPISVELWINPTSITSPDYQMFWDKLDYPFGWTVGAFNTWGLLTFGFCTDNSGAGSRWTQSKSTNTLNNDVWNCIGISYNGNNLISGVNMYLDGIEDTVVSENDEQPLQDISNNVDAWIGSRAGTTYEVSATIDEYRFSNIERNETWMKAAYNTMNQSTGFLVMYDYNDFVSNLTITINHTFIDEDLSNFPVLVTLNTTIGSACQSAGQDIRFFDDEHTPLNYEIELWNASGTSYVWVNVTDISSTVDTIFYLYYNNSLAPDGQDVTGTWDDSYLAVWHMDGTTDSTANGWTLTNNGATIKHNEILGDCYSFDGSTDYLSRAYNSDYNVGDMTIECFSYSENVGSQRMMVTYDDSWYFWQGNSNLMTFGIHAGSDAAGSVNDADTWIHYAGIFDGSNVKVFKNASLEDTTASGGYPDSTDAFYIGVHGPSFCTYWDGYIDEVRYSDVARSNAWLSAGFHSQNQTTGFLTMGSPPPPVFGFSFSNEVPTKGSSGISIWLPSINMTTTTVNRVAESWMTSVSMSPHGGTATGWLDINNTDIYFNLSGLPLSYSTTYNVIGYGYENVTGVSYNNWSFTTVANDPPVVTQSDPANHITNVSLAGTTLYWNATDTYSDNITGYDVYFGTSATPPKVSTNQTILSYSTGAIAINTTYYWRIVAWDEHGLDGTSGTWNFVSKSPLLIIRIENYTGIEKYEGTFYANGEGLIENDVNTSIFNIGITTDNDFLKNITVWGKRRVDGVVQNRVDKLYFGYGYNLSGNQQVNDSYLDFFEGLDSWANSEGIFIDYNSSAYNFTIELKWKWKHVDDFGEYTAYKIMHFINVSQSNYLNNSGKWIAKDMVINYTYWNGYIPGNESYNSYSHARFDQYTNYLVYGNWTTETGFGTKTLSTKIYGQDLVNGSPSTWDREAVILASSFSTLAMNRYNTIQNVTNGIFTEQWGATGFFDYPNVIGINNSWWVDIEPPAYDNITVDCDMGINSTGTCNVTIHNITDFTTVGIVTNISINAGQWYFENSSCINGTNISLVCNLSNGFNLINIVLIDYWGTKTYYNTTRSVCLSNFVCVDEETGDYFNLSKITNLVVKAPEINWDLDLKALGITNFTYMANTSYPGTLHPHALRFELGYAANAINLTRYFDMTIPQSLDDPIRIAIPEGNGQNIYQQTVVSNRERPFSCWSLDADAWVCMDMTRMAGGTESPYLQYVYTVDALYYFKIYDADGIPTTLTTIDGGKAMTISLNLLEYAVVTFPNMTDSQVGVQKLSNETLLIYYYFPDGTNTWARITMVNSTGYEFLNYTETGSPNEFFVYYDWSTVTPQPDLNETMTLTGTGDGNAPCILEFTLNTLSAVFSGDTGISPLVFFIAIIALLILGLTLFAASVTFSFFGPIVLVIGLALSVLAEQIWYIHLLQLVLILFIGIMIVIYRYSFSGQNQYGGV